MLDPTLDQCRNLALDLAPELRAAPLYVVRPVDYPFPSHCDAFASRLVDYHIRQQLIDSGEWQGRGNFIVFGRIPEDGESLIGLLLHEIAHCLPFHPFTGEDNDPTTEQIDRQRLLTHRWATEPDRSDRPPWEPGHGLWFIRACLHLRHRAAQAGLDIPLPAINFAGARYGLSGAWRYRDALGDEPGRLVDATFGEIFATDPPAEFTQLFDDDTNH